MTAEVIDLKKKLAEAKNKGNDLRLESIEKYDLLESISLITEDIEELEGMRESMLIELTELGWEELKSKSNNDN